MHGKSKLSCKYLITNVVDYFKLESYDAQPRSMKEENIKYHFIGSKWIWFFRLGQRVTM